MKTRKPLPTDPKYAEYVAAKHKRLLAWAKENVKLDEGSDDCKTFDRETARFFAVAGNVAKYDPAAKGQYRLMVRTKMFGGQAKHVDMREFRRMRSELAAA